MSTAQVVLKLSPFELQVIADALRVWVGQLRSLEGRASSFDQLKPTVFDGDTHHCDRVAQGILADIGLKERR